jgi:outer membrane protein TolC
MPLSDLFLHARARYRQPWVIGLVLISGCATWPTDYPEPEALKNTAAPAAAKSAESLAQPKSTDQATKDPAVRPAAVAQQGPGAGARSNRAQSAPLPPALSPAPPTPSPTPGAESGRDPMAASSAPAPSGEDTVAAGGKPMTVEEVINLAFRRQPSLRAQLELIEQARGQKGIAFAPFLPTAGTAYSVGGFDLNVGGQPLNITSRNAGFAVLPPGFAVPVGLKLNTGYELAEFKVAWLVTDFGKRLGLYRAAQISVDIAQLQTDRAYQTVASDVAVAYYSVLRAMALRRAAWDAVRRSEDQRDVAQKLAKGGVLEREQVLRAEVQLAESQRLLDIAEEGVGIASAALNLAIGLKPGELVGVVEPPGIPVYQPALADCLQTAINRRREFQVARRAIEVAQEGNRVANASFAPRIAMEGTLLDLQQSAPRDHLDVAVGFIRMDWQMFEGGRRVAAHRIADSKLREAMAQCESIADTIAFQVNENYRKLVTARLGIDRARPAVDQARENYRLVRARAAEGDATPSEITDAEAALTRAEQNYLNSNYDFLSAIVRLEFVIGVTPSPLNNVGH